MTPSPQRLQAESTEPTATSDDGHTSAARVVIAEELPLLRHALDLVLSAEPDFEVVASAGAGVEAVEAVQQTDPDLIMLGIDLPGMGGLEAARLSRQRHPRTRIVIVTEHEEEELVLTAVRSGVDGYLLKDVHPHELADALRAALRGQSPIAPTLVPHLVDELRQSARPLTLSLRQTAPEDKLSRRELEILQLAARGLSNKQIAARLSITEGTVKNHVHNALRKLNLSNRLQAASYVVRRGLAD